jgi:hypothetical protein
VPGQNGGQGKVDEKLKKCKEIYFNYDEQTIIDYTQQLQNVCNEYIKKYHFCNEFSAWYTRESIKIQKYLPGDGYYSWHCERFNNLNPINNRHLVFLTYLNDVTDDGETEFYYQKLKVRPQKGLTLIWPADWTHTHRGVPSMTQMKYIITGWYHYV